MPPRIQKTLPTYNSANNLRAGLRVSSALLSFGADKSAD